MFDDLREQANTAPFFEEEEAPELEPRPRTPPKRFLGMTPAQRFLLATLLLFVTCILSTLFLLVTQKMVIPFL
jgi:hypothetical protein